MHFWLNYCGENRIERIPVAVKDIDHLFSLTGKIIKVKIKAMWGNPTLSEN